MINGNSFSKKYQSFVKKYENDLVSYVKDFSLDDNIVNLLSNHVRDFKTRKKRYCFGYRELGFLPVLIAWAIDWYFRTHSFSMTLLVQPNEYMWDDPISPIWENLRTIREDIEKKIPWFPKTIIAKDKLCLEKQNRWMVKSLIVDNSKPEALTGFLNNKLLVIGLGLIDPTCLDVLEGNLCHEDNMLVHYFKLD